MVGECGVQIIRKLGMVVVYVYLDMGVSEIFNNLGEQWGIGNNQ